VRVADFQQQPFEGVIRAHPLDAWQGTHRKIRLSPTASAIHALELGERHIIE
jgi:hypothetical protein